MPADSFQQAKRYLAASPLSRIGAQFAAAIAAICLALLLPLLYVTVDLLVYRGNVTTLPDSLRESFPTATVSGQVGLLSLVAREQGHWYTPALETVARIVPWTWRETTLGAPNLALLATLIGLAALLVIIRGVALNLSSYWATVATVDAGIRMRRAVYTHGQRLSAVAIRPEAQAEAGELVSDRVDAIQDGFDAAQTTLIRAPLVAVLSLIVLISSHGWLTISILALTALTWLVAGSAAAYFRRDARHAARRVESRLGLIRESMTGLQLAKSYLMERFSQTRFERHLSELSKSAWRRQRGDAVSRPTLLAVISLAGLLGLFLAGRVVLSGDMTLASLATKAVALATLVVALGRWFGARPRVRRASGAAADVFEFLDRRGDAGQAIDAEFLQPLAKQLELLDISLREPGTGRMLLEHVSFRVPAGTTAAVVSADPAESHALAYVLTRFSDPTAGEVRIDGKNTRWVTTESIRTQVAMILETGLTFSDTVANNIGCGDAIYTLPQVIAASKLAHAHQFVQRLPYGYETRIGTGGMQLSQGECFRIALARALLRDPSLLVIEEPTGGLDADSVVLIDDTLSRVRAGRTVIFLARRPATVRSADQVFVLRHGKLAAAGSHDELLESSELYRQIHLKQSLAAGAN